MDRERRIFTWNLSGLSLITWAISRATKSSGKEMLHHRVQNLCENSIIPKWQAVISATKGHLLWYTGRLAVVGLPHPGTHFESLPIDGWKDSPGPAGHPAPIAPPAPLHDVSQGGYKKGT